MIDMAEPETQIEEKTDEDETRLEGREQGRGESAEREQAIRPGGESLPASLQKTDEKLKAGPDGLSSAEAARRIEEYGYNELEEKKTNPFLKFLSYYWGPIPWMIEAAAILSALVHHWSGFIIIMVLLVMNAVVGFWEEYQAGNAIDALKSHLAPKARAKRDGEWKTIPARELVPGDVVRLRIGAIVPADCEILEGDELQIDQSALTGESLPVTRKIGDQVYSGSIVRQGENDAAVYATGRNTYFGKTARLVESAHNVSHFQKAILKIGDYLIVIALALVILILATALFRGDSILTTLEFALILTVAAVPVAMPAVLSVTMAVGARKLARKEAIVSRLASIEELAGVDVLCSDKTGTITQNKLTTDEPVSLGEASPDEIVLYGALASRKEDEDTIDLAIIGAVKDKERLKDFTINHFTPFDPVKKRAEAEVTDKKNKTFKVTKGAPQVILELAANAHEVGERIDKTVNDLASRGYRSIGVARTDAKGNWQYLGIIPLYDPPREDSKETIDDARKLGIKIKMVTGDQIAIAGEIARQVGLGTKIQNADIFRGQDTIQNSKLAEAIDTADGFSQVFPEHKYRIVETLQKQGHIVGMTGDGVNDAPALKKADAGVAVSGSTDAARMAADIVLLSPGLSVIIDAIRISRIIFKRMTSYSIYRIAETIRVLLFMTLAILVFNFYPVTAVMIVLLALLNDGPILAIAYDRAYASARPEAWNMREVLGVSTILGIIGVAATFGIFYLFEKQFHLSREIVQTAIFLKLAVAGHLTIFITRTRGPFWSVRPSAVLFWAAVITKIIATLAAVYGIFMAPIGWKWALVVWGYALAWFFVNDLVKLAAYKIVGSGHEGLAFKTAGRRESDLVHMRIKK